MTLVLERDAQRCHQRQLPVVPHFDIEITPDERLATAELAARIAREERRLSSLPPFDADLGVGSLPGPTLLLEDHGGVQLALEQGARQTFSYRPLLLAEDGDLVVVAGDRNPAFEKYCRETLGLGSVDVWPLAVPDPRRPLSLSCAEDGGFLEYAARVANQAGALTLLPYQATGGVWRLAGEIARRAAVPVRVAGPPPGLDRAVNDKLWFARRAAQLLGKAAIPPSHTVYGPAALVAHLLRLARRHEAVALKLSHSAASLGNMVLESGEFAALAPSEIAEMIDFEMLRRGWTTPFPLQVTAWESPLVGSPSAQLWIPLEEQGPPIVEGIFDQIVSGRAARFSGAGPSRLPAELQHRIATEAMSLGLLFQRLGYFGRCSFDAVVVERPRAAPAVHWVECNGRWGGVSIPMTLANRLTGDWARQDLLILTRRQKLEVRDTAALLERIGDRLFRPGGSAEGAVLLAPGRVEAHRGVDLMILGRDEDDALARSEALLDELFATESYG